MVNKSGIGMEATEEIKRKVEATVKIMTALAEFDGKGALETLTGCLISIMATTAKDGKEAEIVDDVIKELKDGIEFMKKTKPLVGKINDIVNHLKNNPNLN